MEYRPKWPARRKKSPSLPLGVCVDYDPGDEAALLHLLGFLRLHFQLTEADFKETIDEDDERYPDSWFVKDPIPLKRLLKEAEGLEAINGWITVGFRYEDQLLFRAYKAHLDQDKACAPGLKEFFAQIEKDFFGTQSQLN